MQTQRAATAALAAGLVVGLALPAGAQERPRVTYSESSGGTGPTCAIGAAATDCGGGSITGPLGPVLVGAPSVVPFPVVVPPVFGAGGAGAGADADVDRSTRGGTAVAR